MAWEIDCRGEPRYVHKERVGGRVVSRVLGRGVVGQIALESILRHRLDIRELKAKEIELETRLDLYEKIVNQIIEQSLIGVGYVCRQNVWQLVKRLNKPLTEEERAHIKHTKSIIRPIYPLLLGEDLRATEELAER